MSAKIADIFFIIILELTEIKYKIKGRCKIIGNSNNMNWKSLGGDRHGLERKCKQVDGILRFK